MKLVILESPFRGKNLADRNQNIAYAKRCAKRCALDKESILASHLLFPQFLDEDDPKERELGIWLGLAWVSRADFSAFFTDRGWSKGMLAALKYCLAARLQFRFRSLDKPVEFPVVLSSDWYMTPEQMNQYVDMRQGTRIK